jgi:predicted amidohydrolase
MTIIATSAFEGTQDPDENLRRIITQIDEAADAGAELVIFPECALQGYPTALRKSTKEGLLTTWAAAEDVVGGIHTTQILEHAIARKIHVIYGMTEKTDKGGVCYNTAVLTGPEGHIGSYRKVHLGNAEQIVWRRGSSWPVFETSIGKIGMLICVDKAWPESTRELVLGGADILIMPTAWAFTVGGDDEHEAAWAENYFLFERTRAAENARWFISSNFVGPLDDDFYPGYSQFIDPKGHVVASAKSEPGLVIQDIDIQGGIAEVNAMWHGPRLIRERRAETYKILGGESPVLIDG